MSAYLPKDEEKLSTVITDIVNRGRSYRNPLTVDWTINYYYLQGVRKFNILSWKTGQVQMTWESPEGQLNFRFEDILEQYNRELGQLMRLNINPKVEPRKALELDGVRKAAVGQVFLDHMVAPLSVEEIKLAFCEGLLQFGTMGLAAWVSPDVNLNMDAMIETVPPWQLLPVPARPTMGSETRGFIRHRWVPYYELLEKQGKVLKFPQKSNPSKGVDERLEIRWVHPGDRIVDNQDVGMDGQDGLSSSKDPVRDGIGSWFGGSKGGEAGQKDSMEEPFVHLIEYWCPDHRGRLQKAVTLIGRYVARNTTFEDVADRPYMPLSIAKYHHTGGFYGRSFLSPLVPLNQEAERMYTNLFKNVQERDEFPLLLIPANKGIKKQHLTSVTRPRVAFYEEDYAGTKFQVEQIEPINSNDFPGRVAKSAIELMDRLGRNSELYRGGAPGRVDSASGLGLLYETSNISRNAAIASIAEAFTGIYKCILGKGNTLLKIGDTLRLGTTDDAVAGVVVDPQSGELSLESNPIPAVDEVKISIKETEPKLLTQRKQELILMLDKQLIDRHDFLWTNYIENLGFPIEDPSEIEEHKKAMWRNIIQFGDGTRPGGLIIGAHDNHEIHLRVIKAFMSRIVYSMASEEVQSAFEERKAGHEKYLGGGFPDAIPYPENAMGAPGPTGAPPLPPGLPPQLQKEAARLASKAAMPQGGGMMPPPPGTR